MTLEEYIDQISAIGRYHFTSQEAETALKISRKALNMAVFRLKKKEKIASPAKQFYIVIPPEYKKLGCLPPDQFVPHLMKYWNLPYYVCLLSAAEYYGAAHQKPQYFQVMTKAKKTNLQCGQIKIRFVKKIKIQETPCKTFNTPRSVINVSTPEATAMDLVNYPWQSGGLNHVATIIGELAEVMNSSALCALAKQSQQTMWIQRLGYLLDILNFKDLAVALKEEIKKKKLRIIPLNAHLPITGYPRDYEWKIAINMKIESDV